MKLVDVTEKDHKKLQELELGILLELDRICKAYDLHYSVAYGTLIGAIRHRGFIPWDDDIDVYMPRKDYLKLEEICKKELKSDFFYQNNSTDPECFYLYDKIRLNGTVFRESFVSKYNIHHGVYIDIFPIDKIPQNIFKRKIQYYKFHFYRTGVMAKYLMLEAREGKKKVVFSALKLLYFPFPLKWLYKKTQNTAMKYVDSVEGMDAISFFSPYKQKDIFECKVFENYTTCEFMGKTVSVIKNYDKVLKQIYGDYMKLPPKDKQTTRHSVTELRI